MGRHHARQAEDFYKTPPACTQALLNVETFADTIAEPACGDGAISEVLWRAGYEVYSSDLYPRGYGVSGWDFLKADRKLGEDLITNPPFALADRFVLHAHELGFRKMAFLLRLAWLEGERRRETIFSKCPPRRVYVFSARQTLWKGDDPNPRTTGGMAAYAWFVFEQPPYPSYLHPTLHWISRAECETISEAELAKEFF